jgi:hypothetical protein
MYHGFGRRNALNTYIGTKLINAMPMNRQDYNDYRGWDLPDDEDGADAGFLVEYNDPGHPNHPNHAGYISWSPEEVFVNAYRRTTGMTFGQAVEAMKVGIKVARVGWNGKGMFLYYVPAAEYPAQTGAAKAHFGDDALVPYRAYIAMLTVTGEVVPWVASQSDVLEEDWGIV